MELLPVKLGLFLDDKCMFVLEKTSFLNETRIECLSCNLDQIEQHKSLMSGLFPRKISIVLGEQHVTNYCYQVPNKLERRELHTIIESRVRNTLSVADDYTFRYMVKEKADKAFCHVWLIRKSVLTILKNLAVKMHWRILSIEPKEQAISRQLANRYIEACENNNSFHYSFLALSCDEY